MKHLIVIFLCSLVAVVASATPAGVNFQGRLMKNDVAVEGSNVTLTLRVVTPNAAECLLYEETHTLDMTDSGGVFSVKIGGGTRTVNDEGLTIAQVFSNTGSALTGLACNSGTTYTSASTDTRKIYATFNDGTDTVAFSTPYTTQSVPYAIESERISGKTSADLLQVNNVGATALTQANLESLFTTPGYSYVQALLAGSYVQSSSTGAALPSFASDPASAPDGSIWYDSVTHEIKYQSNGSPQAIGASGSGITAGGNTVTGTTVIGTNSNHSFGIETNGTTRMTVLNDGKVGIGTTTPTQMLHVKVPAGASGGIRIEHPDWSSDINIYARGGPGGAGVIDSPIESLMINGGGDSTHFLMFGTNNHTERMRITGDGDIGIGTTTPASLIDASAATGGLMTLSRADTTATANDTVGKIQFWNNDTELTTQNIYADIEAQSAATTSTDAAAGNLIFRTTGSTVAGSPVERMRINSAGNVGIGTTSPGGPLDIAATPGTPVKIRNTVASESIGPNNLVYIHRDSGYVEQRIHSGSAILDIGLHSGDGPYFWSYGAYPMAFATDDSERMRITATGNVGIGTTGPTTTLQVAGVISPSVDNTHALGDGALRFTAVYATNGAIQTSDLRQKKNIQNSDLGLDFINSLRPVSYYWKSGPDKELHYGLIAQEAEQAVLKAHGNTEVKAPIVDYDEKNDRYGLKYTELISPLIKAVKEFYQKWMDDSAELHAQVDQLKMENAALKAWACSKDPSAEFCQ